MIADWCEILTSVPDRRSRKYFFTIIPGMLLGCGRNRLRKDAALFDVPVAAKRPCRGSPRKYGRNQISLAHRGGHRHGWTTTKMVLYGKEQTVTFKTFLATQAPADGVTRVVIVKRSAELFSRASAH
jgi:hypothetical protein